MAAAAFATVAGVSIGKKAVDALAGGVVVVTTPDIGWLETGFGSCKKLRDCISAALRSASGWRFGMLRVRLTTGTLVVSSSLEDGLSMRVRHGACLRWRRRVARPLARSDRHSHDRTLTKPMARMQCDGHREAELLRPID